MGRLFDWLGVGQVIPSHPAIFVRGPKPVVKKGKTLVLDAEQTRKLLASIDISHVVGRRDRTLIDVMDFGFPPVDAVVGMKVEDDPQGKLCAVSVVSGPVETDTHSLVFGFSPCLFDTRR